jgi:hypothetical protein
MLISDIFPVDGSQTVHALKFRIENCSMRMEGHFVNLQKIISQSLSKKANPTLDFLLS